MDYFCSMMSSEMEPRSEDEFEEVKMEFEEHYEDDNYLDPLFDRIFVTDWKLKPNVECKIVLEKLNPGTGVVTFKEEFDIDRECNEQEKAQDGEVEDTRNNSSVLRENGSSYAYQKSKELLIELGKTFDQNGVDCNMCHNYIHKLSEHILTFHNKGDQCRVSTSRNINEDEAAGYADTAQAESTSSSSSVSGPDDFVIITPMFKRPRGRPRKIFGQTPFLVLKRPRGRPRKIGGQKPFVVPNRQRGRPRKIGWQKQKPLAMLERPRGRPRKIGGREPSRHSGLASTSSGSENLHTADNNKQNKCVTCGKSFSTAESLENHIILTMHSSIVDTGEWPFSCQICGKRYVTNASLVLHTKMHNKEEAHQSNPSTHSADKRYTCEDCGEHFPFKSTFIKHLDFCNVETYLCKCGENLIGKQAFELHCRTHSHPKRIRYECLYCDKIFPSSTSLDNHNIELHMAEKSYSCEICDEKFRVPHQLTAHMRIHNRAEKPYNCEVCGKDFLWLNSFTTHKMSHTQEAGEKQLNKCDVCGNEFELKEELKKHRDIHNYQGFRLLFRCEICEIYFNNQNEINIHKSCHAQKSHNCETCGKEFLWLESLVIHKQSHAGENPYI